MFWENFQLKLVIGISQSHLNFKMNSKLCWQLRLAKQIGLFITSIKIIIYYILSCLVYGLDLLASLLNGRVSQPKKKIIIFIKKVIKQVLFFFDQAGIYVCMYVRSHIHKKMKKTEKNVKSGCVFYSSKNGNCKTFTKIVLPKNKNQLKRNPKPNRFKYKKKQKRKIHSSSRFLWLWKNKKQANLFSKSTLKKTAAGNEFHKFLNS